jgi:hypothetical protein
MLGNKVGSLKMGEEKRKKKGKKGDHSIQKISDGSCLTLANTNLP